MVWVITKGLWTAFSGKGPAPQFATSSVTSRPPRPVTSRRTRPLAWSRPVEAASLCGARRLVERPVDSLLSARAPSGRIGEGADEALDFECQSALNIDPPICAGRARPGLSWWMRRTGCGTTSTCPSRCGARPALPWGASRRRSHWPWCRPRTPRISGRPGRVFPRHGGKGEGRRAEPRPHALGNAAGRRAETTSEAGTVVMKSSCWSRRSMTCLPNTTRP